MRRAILLAVVSLGPLAFAPLPFPKPLQGDLKQLQGTWVLQRDKQTSDEYFQTWGEPAPTETIQIDRDRLRHFKNGEPTSLEWRIWLNEKGTPRVVTLDSVSRAPKWLSFKGRVRGIYILEGDRLFVRINGADLNSPPEDFTSDGPDFRLLAYRRKYP